MTDSSRSNGQGQDRSASPTGLFLVTYVYDEGLHPAAFRIVRADSRRAVAAAMLADPYHWESFLRAAGLFQAATRGEAGYYGDPRPVSADALLERIDATRVDGDSRAQLAVLPVPRIDDIDDGCG